MDLCSLCQEQTKKSHGGKPHQYLQKLEEERKFTGSRPGGFIEQDFQCLQCAAKFTHSNDKNDFGWTLWRG